MKKQLLAGLAVGVLMLGMAGMVGASSYTVGEPIVPTLHPGWNLVGLKGTLSAMAVTDLGAVTSVWKWTTVNGKETWAVHIPGDLDKGVSYAVSKGFGQFDTIEPGEGFWVNVPATAVTTTTPITTTTTLTPATTTTTSTSTTTTTLVPNTGEQTVMWKSREWQQSGSLSYVTWDEANTYCTHLTEGGHDDWYIPSINTLMSLIVCSNGTQVTSGPSNYSGASNCGDGNSASYTSPTINPAFTNFASFYWSSTTVVDYPGSAWGVYFVYGSLSGESKSHHLSVRCVRGGP